MQDAVRDRQTSNIIAEGGMPVVRHMLAQVSQQGKLQSAAVILEVCMMH